MCNLDLRTIDPSKISLNFLEGRLKTENYRGIQISQHNRYSLSEILIILKILYQKVGENKMEIRTTDISKRPENLPNEFVFAEYVNEVQRQVGRCTQDSIRKNLFVDLHRMGLINRYSNDELVVPYTRKKLTSISITDNGLELINENLNVLERQMKYSECIDKLLGGFSIKIMKILIKLKSISLLEFIFFVSFIDQKIDDKVYLEDDIIEFIKDFRSLSTPQRDLVERRIKDYANPENFEGLPKNEKRDYHNWKNEAQQILSLLNQTALYEYNAKNEILFFKSNKEDALFKKDDLTRLQRSTLEKEKYFREHSVSKQKGYELHHIVPLLRAKNSDHFFLLDVWQNLLYIDGKTHAIITQNGNKQIILKILENNNIELTDLENPLLIVFNDNVFYGVHNKEEMISKNKELLEII